jgi:hypothetical protein
MQLMGARGIEKKFTRLNEPSGAASPRLNTVYFQKKFRLPL